MKTKYLITGYQGFVGTYFLDYLDSLGEKISIVGVSKTKLNNKKAFKYINLIEKVADLNNRLKIQNILAHYRPENILHLAANSSVAYSWNFPINSFINNTNIFLNVIESVRVLKLESKILSIGSSEEYGIVKNKDLPLKESMPLNPISPYAVARVSQEMLGKLYTESFGLNIIMTRSFNHFGPSQSDQFVISSLTKQIAQRKTNLPSITVGNTSIVRDFLDVRDVVKAYHLLFEKGTNGEIYNVCSGNGMSIQNALDMCAKIEEITLDINVNSSLIRPNDNPTIIGDNSKIIKDTDWKIEYNFRQSLTDMLNYWKNIK